jgi:hypothetical protein
VHRAQETSPLPAFAVPAQGCTIRSCHNPPVTQHPRCLIAPTCSAWCDYWSMTTSPSVIPAVIPHYCNFVRAARITWRTLLGCIQAAGLHAGAVDNARSSRCVDTPAGRAGLAGALALAGLVGAGGALCAGCLARPSSGGAWSTGLRCPGASQLVAGPSNCSKQSQRGQS